jgi:hypothetical protein
MISIDKIRICHICHDGLSRCTSSLSRSALVVLVSSSWSWVEGKALPASVFWHENSTQQSMQDLGSHRNRNVEP